MAKCNTCGLEVLDETEACPLCRSILEQTEPVENMYPNVRIRMRRLKLFSRIYLFAAIVAEALVFCWDYFTPSPLWWSAVTGMGLLYAYMVLRYAILGQSGYRSKVIVLTVLAILVAVFIDFVGGYQGWSIDYVLPSGILLVDVIILGCMIVNRRNWQSYLMWQLLMVLCGLLPMILYLKGLEHNVYLSFMPLAVSGAIFLGTVIIGDRRAQMELIRRFHF